MSEQKVVIQFAVKSTREVKAPSEIFVGFVKESSKNVWIFHLTGEKSRTIKHLHKDKWVLFNSLLGARAHLKSIIESDKAVLDMAALELQKKIDALNEVLP